MVEEELLLRHPIDCPICDKAGECDLQDYHFRYGQAERRADIRPFTSRRREVGDGHAVRRSLRDVQPLRPLHPRDQRHQRADGHRPRQRTRRSTSCPASRWPTSSPATWSTSARWGRWATRTFSTSSGSGSCSGTPAFAPAAPPAARSGSRRTRTASTASSPARTRWSTSGGSATTAATTIRHVHHDQRLDAAAGAAQSGDARSSVDWTRHRRASFAGDSPQAGRLAAVLSPYLTVEEAYLLAKLVAADRCEGAVGLGPGAEGGRGRAVPQRLHHRRGEMPQPPRRGGDRRAISPARRARRSTSCSGELDAGTRFAACGSPAATSERLDRRGDRRAVRSGCSCWWCRTCSPRRYRDRATYELARRRLRRARRLLRQPPRPAAVVSLGDPSAERRADGGQPVLGAVGLPGPVQCPDRAQRDRRARSSTSPPPRRRAGDGIDLKSNLLAAATSETSTLLGY